MAEFTYIPIQTIPYKQSAIMNTAIGCTKGYVYHRNESGLVTLRGVVNNPCSNFARYKVIAVANIALSEGATVGPISVALAISGEPLQASKAIVTPAAVGDFFNVTCEATIDVPRGCCAQVTLENVSDGQPDIDMQNLNVDVDRKA